MRSLSWPSIGLVAFAAAALGFFGWLIADIVRERGRCERAGGVYLRSDTVGHCVSPEALLKERR